MGIFSRYWLISVTRQSQYALAAHVHYMDPDREMVAGLEAGVDDFVITKAWVDGCRSSKGDLPMGHQEVPLQGVVAYLGSGPSIRSALAGDSTGLWAEAFLEGVKGVIQAETFLYRERGYPSMAAYEDYFWRDFARTCVYYSHPEAESPPFSAGLVHHQRDCQLFTRHRFALVRSEGGQHMLTLGLSDSFHEMGISLTVDGAGRIQQASGHSRRVPGPICRRVENSFPRMVGMVLAPEWRKPLMETAGGPEGCTHMADLMQEAVRVFGLACGNG